MTTSHSGSLTPWSAECRQGALQARLTCIWLCLLGRWRGLAGGGRARCFHLQKQQDRGVSSAGGTVQTLCSRASMPSLTSSASGRTTALAAGFLGWADSRISCSRRREASSGSRASRGREGIGDTREAGGSGGSEGNAHAFVFQSPYHSKLCPSSDKGRTCDKVPMRTIKHERPVNIAGHTPVRSPQPGPFLMSSPRGSRPPPCA